MSHYLKMAKPETTERGANLMTPNRERLTLPSGFPLWQWLKQVPSGIRDVLHELKSTRHLGSGPSELNNDGLDRFPSVVQHTFRSFICFP